IHLAGLIISSESVSDPAQYYDNNVSGTLNLLAAMRRNAVDRIVFSSSAAVYGEPEVTPMPESHPCIPLNPYGTSKLMIVRVLQDYSRAYGLHSVSLDSFNASVADWDGESWKVQFVDTHLF